MNAISFDDYCAIDAVNWSSLKHLSPKHGGSPLRYQHALKTESADTAARALGRAAHTLTFEPDRFDLDYAVWTEGDRRGKAWLDFKAANGDRTILKADEADTARAIADAVRSSPAVAPYLDGGEYERTVLWHDPTTGLKCKARLDWINPRRRALVDLKTTVSIEARRFGLIAARLGYPCQVAHYFEACVNGLGWTPDECVIVAVESSAPHDVGVFVLDDDALTYGSEIVAELLSELAARRKSGRWPGLYRDEPQRLELPAYLFEDDGDLETFGIYSSGGAK